MKTTFPKYFVQNSSEEVALSFLSYAISVSKIISTKHKDASFYGGTIFRMDKKDGSEYLSIRTKGNLSYESDTYSFIDRTNSSGIPHDVLNDETLDKTKMYYQRKFILRLVGKDIIEVDSIDKIVEYLIDYYEGEVLFDFKSEDRK